MAEASISIGTVYEDVDAYPDFATDFPHLTVPTLLVKPHPQVVRAPYEVPSVGAATVEDGTTSGEAVSLDMGDIATEATAFVIRNHTGQDLAISINGDAAARAALLAELDSQLDTLGDFTAEDDAADIVAAIASAASALGTLMTDLAAAGWSMPSGAALAYSSPTGGATTPITSIAVVTTATQTGNRDVDFQVFGDPA